MTKVKFCLALLSLLCAVGFKADAAYSNSFSGSVGYTTGDVSEYVTKTTSTDTKAGVNWNYTNKTDHKQWFIIVNSNGAQRGSVLLDSYDGMNHNFSNSNTTYSYIYKLRSHREHVIDPVTKISGTWRP